MFKKASQMKLRFDTAKGDLTVEDLWDLPLTSEAGVSLNGIAIAVNKELQASQEESFVSTQPIGNTVLELRLEILKEVIAVKIAENEKARTAAAKKLRKEKLLAIRANKQDEDIQSKTLDEIDALIADIDEAA